MPNWKKVIVSGSDAALNSLNVTTSLTASGIIYPTADGTAGQVLTTNGAGVLSFSNSSVVSASYALSASYAATASSALNAQDVLIRVLNQSGNTIAKGIVVHITASGNSSDIPRVITASYESDSNSANTLGIANESIANGAEGFVMTEGVLKGINTSAFVSGQLIYLGATGSIIGYAPTAPLHSVRLGQVVREQSNNGSIYVRIDNGYELGELHDVVDTTTTSSYGDLLVKSGSVWKNSRQLTGSYGLTGSLTATSFVGPLQGTASWATNALTASYTPSIAGTDNYIPKFNGSSALENSVMYDDGTNIGIGTTSPSTKLHVGAASVNQSSISTSNSTNLGLFVQAVGNDNVTGNLQSGITFGEGNSGLYSYDAGGSGAQGLSIFTGNFSSLSERMRITNAGDVGIGTTSPSYRLHVQDSANIGTIAIGNSTYPGLLYSDAGTGEFRIDNRSSAGAGYITFYPNGQAGTLGSERMRIGTNGSIRFNAYGSGTFTGTATQKLAVDSSGNVIEIPIGAGPVDGSGTANYITRWVDTDTITTSSIYETGGNIGIGTTNPSDKLHVVGNAIVGNSGNISPDSSGNGQLEILGNGYQGYVALDATAMYFGHNSGIRNLTLQTNETDRLTITGAGNVGIGTTTPGSKLEVAGGIASTFGSTNGYVALQAGGATVQGYIEWFKPGPTRVGYMGYNDGSTANNLAIQLENSANFLVNGGNVGINTLTPAYKLSVVGKIALNDGGNSVFIGDNAGLSDDATNNTNVGVGTNALQNNIVGAFNVAVGAYTLQNHLGSFNTALGSHALQFLTTANANNTAVGSYALNANLTGSNTAVGSAALLLTTSGSRNVAMGSNASRLNTFGNRNISIGTAALYENVTGSNNIAIGDNAGRYFGSGTSALSDASGSIFLGNNTRANANNSLNEIVIGTDLIGLGSNTVVLGNDNIVTTALKGNVGVGTTAPASLLSATERVIEISNSNLASLYLDSTTGRRWSVSSISTGELTFWDIDAVAERMRIDTSGNVGIGTSSPSYKLDVNGQQRITLAGFAGIEYHNTPGTWEVYVGTESNTGNARYNSRQGTHSWYANSTATMTLNASGYLGLGTTSPSYLLDVNGTARVTTLIETSAAKYKTNIQPLEPQLSKVTQLEPVTFDWLDKPQTKTNIGLIADEVEKIYPEFVSKTEDGEIEGIEYSKLTTVLIQSIKELKEIVDQQQAQINKLLNK